MRMTAIEKDRERQRQQVQIQRVFDALHATIQTRGIRPDTPVDDVRVDFTDASAIVIAPLVEAVAVLEAIIYASDGCMGHRQCSTHSMDPWQRARALLRSMWATEAAEMEKIR